MCRESSMSIESFGGYGGHRVCGNGLGWMLRRLRRREVQKLTWKV